MGAARRGGLAVAMVSLLVACGPAGATPGAGSAVPPAAGGAVREWMALDAAIPEGVDLSGVARVGTRYVVVGGTGSGPFVATSADAVTWAVAAEQASFVTEGGSLMADLIPTAEGLLSVGLGDGQTVVWTSVDGLAWVKRYESHRLTDEEILAGARFEGGMTSVTSGPAGYAAVGITSPGLVDDFGGAAWASSDGITWQAAPPSIQLLRAPLRGIATLPDGTFVAVGGLRGAVSLTSTDGLDWTFHEGGDSLSPGQLLAVTSRAGALVAVGSDDAGAFSASSRDGASWERGRCTGALTGAQMEAVIMAGDRLVASGSLNGRAAVWVSDDGATWFRVRADFGAGYIRAVHADEERIVAVGSRIWVGPSDGVGDGKLHPASDCGAPDPEPPLPETTPAGDLTRCVMVQGPYATADYPAGLPLCADIGLECALPDPPPPIFICEVSPDAEGP